MAEDINIDNIRYSMEHQEFFQRQVEEAVNVLINKAKYFILLCTSVNKINYEI